MENQVGRFVVVLVIVLEPGDQLLLVVYRVLLFLVVGPLLSMATLFGDSETPVYVSEMPRLLVGLKHSIGHKSSRLQVHSCLPSESIS